MIFWSIILIGKEIIQRGNHERFGLLVINGDFFPFTVKPVDDLEALYQIKQSQPGVVGYCASNSVWSPWHNRDRPSGTGDWEVKSLYLPKGTCADKNPSGIQARLVSNKEPYYFGGNVLSISPSTGLVCKNKSQRKGVRCQDYEIRFCCRPGKNNNLT